MLTTRLLLPLLSLACATAWASLADASGSAGSVPLTTVRVASGLSGPLYVTSPPGDHRRLFIVEQGGDIELLKDGSLQPNPFLDITTLVSIPGGGEQGLLGMAFHPDYASNGFFYVSYTRRSDGASIVARYSRLTLDQADAGSATIIFGPLAQPFSNHNGGCIQFGPDGKLYFGLGDGGSANDPACRAQNPAQALGKMLRMNDDGSTPSDNPFVGDAAYHPLIWALGTRNPWRFSFDRDTGDMYMADVGQNTVEEVNFQSGASLGGENYGWKIMEGNNCFSTNACVPPFPMCNDPSLTMPIHTYGHTGGACSVTGGYMYRGCAMPGLHGTYFFADFCNARIWSFEFDGVAMSNFQDRTAELDPPSFSINSISSFGEDANGEIYIVDIGGEVFKIIEAGGVDCNGNNVADHCEASFSDVRNGSGINPLGFVEVTPAILGTNWDTTVDIVTPGGVASILAMGFTGPVSGIFLAGTIHGELLTLPPLFLDVAAGAHSIPIPVDCSLLDQTIHAQGAAFVLGVPNISFLNNAIDSRIGSF